MTTGAATPADVIRTKMTIEPALEGTFPVTLLDGSEVEVMPVFEMYRRHLADYDLKTVEEITGRKRGRVFSYQRYLAILSEGTDPLPAGS
jgi:hypothetical protein